MPQNHEVVDMKEDFKEDILDNELRTQTTTTETEEKSPQNENSEDTTENQNIYIIKNIDTGEVYDLRDPQQFQKMNDGLSPSPDKYQRKSAPWQEFWYFLHIITCADRITGKMSEKTMKNSGITVSWARLRKLRKFWTGRINYTQLM